MCSATRRRGKLRLCRALATPVPEPFFQFLIHFTSQIALGVIELQCTGCFSWPHSDCHRTGRKLRWGASYVCSDLPVPFYKTAWPKEHLNFIIFVTKHLYILIDWLWTQSKTEIKIPSYIQSAKQTVSQLESSAMKTGSNKYHTYLLSKWSHLLRMSSKFIWYNSSYNFFRVLVHSILNDLESCGNRWLGSCGNISRQWIRMTQSVYNLRTMRSSHTKWLRVRI